MDRLAARLKTLFARLLEFTPAATAWMHRIHRCCPVHPCQLNHAALVFARLKPDMNKRFLYGALLGVLAVNLLLGAQTYFANVHAAE